MDHCYIKAHEELTQERIYEYAGRFAGWACWRFQMSPDHLLDLQHDLFLHLWGRISRLREKGTPDSSLRRYLWQLCRWGLSYYRRRGLIRIPETERCPAPISNEKRDFIFRHHGTTDSSYEAVELHRILDHLPRPYRLMLKEHLEGASGLDISRRYQVSPAYLYSVIHRLPQLLRTYCGYPLAPPEPALLFQRKKRKRKAVRESK